MGHERASRSVAEKGRVDISRRGQIHASTQFQPERALAVLPYHAPASNDLARAYYESS